MPVVASAQLEPYAPADTGAPQITDLASIVHSIENVTALVFGGIVVIMFVFSGILFLTAQGEPEKIKTARHAFLWGVVGVVVGIVAYSIIAIVSSFLTGSSSGASSSSSYSGSTGSTSSSSSSSDNTGGHGFIDIQVNPGN